MIGHLLYKKGIQLISGLKFSQLVYILEQQSILVSSTQVVKYLGIDDVECTYSGFHWKILKLIGDGFTRRIDFNKTLTFVFVTVEDLDFQQKSMN